jgi:hypothetical protein
MGVNQYHLWFDANGVARTRDQDDLSQRVADVTYTDQDFVLIPITEQADVTIPANQVIARVNDPSRVLFSVKTNDDPDNPLSTVNLGRTITKVIDADTAADQTTLDSIALRTLQQQNVYRKATLQTQPDPRRDAHEVYGLTVPDVYSAELWWCRSWTLELKVGAPMSHAISKSEVLVAS